MSSALESELDPGIRRVVAFLRNHGFKTTDSGDGYSKGDTMVCALDVPNVVMVCDRLALIAEADRLRDVLLGAGVRFDASDGTVIQATYDPTDGTAVLLLLGLSDSGLPSSATHK